MSSTIVGAKALKRSGNFAANEEGDISMTTMESLSAMAIPAHKSPTN